jgi:DNA-binding SARP family transcriptional activator/phosphoglycolate phosphatase-like HAD superfamily hydrolase
MRSEPTGPQLVGRLAAILAEAGDDARPTPVELAELLWLARHMEDPDRETQGASTTPAPAPEGVRQPPRTPPPSPAEKPLHEEEPEVPGPPRDDSRVPLHLPSPSGRGKPHASLLAPAPPMLRRRLELQRALRPLKRRTDAPVGRELDERATAHRIAHLGGHPEWWLPVMRPTRERWLRLNLVYDAGPTMPVWRPLVRELHTALAQSGVFRTVTVHRVRPDGTITGTGAHAPADGRTVTLLVSDCMGPQWWAGPAGDRWYATLRRWSLRMPLAVVQPLPERLWRDTALPTAPGLLSAPFPAAPLASLTFTPYDTSDGPPATGTVPLPVLEPDAAWLAHWSTLVASQGGSQLPVSVAHLTSRPVLLDESGNRSDVTRLPAEELVLRFRATASPEAFRLAGHLAVGRPDLPVMRLVQAAVEPRPRPQHLAEVILSGMLTTVPGPPGSYAFRPGVGDLLLRSLPRTARGRTTRLLGRMGALIDERAGVAAGEFRASTPMPSGTETAAEGEPIATVSSESVRRLLGAAGPGRPSTLADRYRLVERLGPGTSLWRGEDTEVGRKVVVRLYPPPHAPEQGRFFLRAAEALAAVDHPNVVAVHDYGIQDDVPYVVMEHLDGIALHTLASPGGYRLPAPLLMSLGRQLADAVTAVHEVTVAHGGLDMTRILILPDGTAKLTLFELGWVRGRKDYRSRDLLALGQLLFHLSSGSPALAGTLPSPDTLTALPVRLRPSYLSALRLLLNGDLASQRQGATLLTDTGLLSQAQSEYPRLSYSLLGPPEVHRGTEHPVATGSPQEQAMLCMLLLHHGRKVSHTALAEGIWGRKPPSRAQALLGTYASRLRNALGPGVLATLSDGYALHTSADFVDVVHCQHLVARAEEERTAGNTELARAVVDTALTLWRGTALDGVPGRAADAARTRLLQLRLSLFATRAELDLGLGEFERAANDLADLVRAHPSREDFRGLHMVALRRQGRIQEALDAYEEYEDSGGRSPQLLLLGRELREELGELPGDERQSTYEGAYEESYEETPTDDTSYNGLYDGLVAALDELPEGPYPTEDRLPTHLLSPQEESAEDASPAEDEGDGSKTLFPAEEELPEPTDDGPGETYGGLPDDLWGEAVTANRTCALFNFADGPETPGTHAALGRALTRLLTASGLEPEEYRLLTHDEGYTVLTEPDVSALPLLSVTLDKLPDRIVELGGAVLRVIFWRTGPDGRAERPDPLAVEDALDRTNAHAIVAVAPSLRDELPQPALSEERLEPLSGPDHSPPTGWYSLFFLPQPYDYGPRPVPPVLGPYPLPAQGLFSFLKGRNKAIVYALPDGQITATRTPAAQSYYEVDLTEHHTDLNVPGPATGGPPVFTGRGEVHWRVTDPVEAVLRAPTDVPRALERHMLSELRRLTLNYPPTHIRGAEHALNDRLSRRFVPGYALHWSVSLSTPTPPSVPPPPHGDSAVADALGAAECVIFGFGGPLTRLYTQGAESEAVRELARLVVERRNPEDALSGRSFLPQDGPVAPLEGYSNPLDLLRAFAGHELAGELNDRLTEIETRAARTAEPRDYSDLLVRTLDAKGVELAVVTDHATVAAETYLRERGLTSSVRGGVHGRAGNLTLLMPNTPNLHRALDRLGARAARCLMIGYSVAERQAAYAVGMPFIAFARDEQAQRPLSGRDGARLLVSGLRPLLTAAQSL